MFEALEQAGLAELEPVMRLEVSTPQDHVGNVIADLTARRGRVTELDSLALGESRIVALVPLVEMFGYASDLRSLTGGRADFAAEPSCYEFRPAPVKLNQ
jgi:elongation factor G